MKNKCRINKDISIDICQTPISMDGCELDDWLTIHGHEARLKILFQIHLQASK